MENSKSWSLFICSSQLLSLQVDYNLWIVSFRVSDIKKLLIQDTFVWSLDCKCIFSLPVCSFSPCFRPHFDLTHFNFDPYSLIISVLLRFSGGSSAHSTPYSFTFPSHLHFKWYLFHLFHSNCLPCLAILDSYNLIIQAYVSNFSHIV